MRLLIDAGNTLVKWALVRGQDWVKDGTLPVGEAGMLAGQLVDMPDIQEAWVSNVAGEEVARHIRKIGVLPVARINFIVATERQCGVVNGYRKHSQLGSDRWAALIAAWNLVHGKCLVVSCGTAITMDSLSERGTFIGGAILPGPELMMRSLVGATSQLKEERGKYAEFPLTTADAIYSGVIQACAGAIERQYALLDHAGAPLLLGGGAAGMLQSSIRLPVRHVDNLVLKGLLYIALERG